MSTSGDERSSLADTPSRAWKALHPRELYKQLALVLVWLLLLILAIEYTALYVVGTRSRDASAQLSYVRLARTIGDLVRDELHKDAPVTGLLDRLRNTILVYPVIGIYLVDSKGNIRADLSIDGLSAPPFDKVREEGIPELRDVIARYLSEGPSRLFPVYGPDPHTPGRSVPFVAAPLEIPELQTSHVYVTLAAGLTRVAGGLSEEAFHFTALVAALSLSLGGAYLAALWLFRRTTTRFTRIIDAVKRFAAGDYSERLPVYGTDELGDLALAVNTMADQIVARDDERRALLAEISHDLQSPIAILTLHADAVLNPPPSFGAEDAHRSLLTIRSRIDSISQLLRELFELSRLEATAKSYQSGRCGISELLSETVSGFAPRARETGVALECRLPDAKAIAIADRLQLERVLSNLIGNALRHTADGGRVTVSAALQPGAVEVSVEDTGEGIPPSELQSLFQRFAQGTHTAKRAKGLAGLGLAICRQIVQLHGSELKVASTVGVGTRFYFTLPLSSE